MNFRCMIALRNKTVARTFPLSFDNANDRLSQDQKFCFHGNFTSRFPLILG